MATANKMLKMADSVAYATAFAGFFVIFLLYLWNQFSRGDKNRKVHPSKEKLLGKRIERFQDLNKKQNYEKLAPSTTSGGTINNDITNLRAKKQSKSFTAQQVVLPSRSFHQDSKNEVPVTNPIKTLDELLLWRPGFDEFSVSHIPLKKCSRDANKPKTMVCHDMKGGYIEDRFVQGYGSKSCYHFHHWQLIDSFCYFSHNFVTIPPPSWTNAAHTNGVKVLGTIITEWEDGAKLCMELLQTDQQIERVVNILVDVAEYYGFEGWLINIENGIVPIQVNKLVKFVESLTVKMHERIGGAEVIWYDSVTYKGELKWQNKLCVDNRIFFDACDGIFLNYNWTIGDLQHSLYLSGAERQHDIYVGVDVFGRGCFGGGGWNTYKALQVIREKNISAAIFAPGWVMEKFGEEEFVTNNTRFWGLLTDYLYPHVVTSLPIVTTFCNGYGNAVYISGKVVKKLEWTNLSTQSLQPTFPHNFYQLGTKSAMEIIEQKHSIEDSYNGGGCMVIKGKVTPMEKQIRTVFRLFKADVKLTETDQLFISFTFKEITNRVQLYLLLLFEDSPNYVVFEPPLDESEDEINSRYFIPDGQEGNYKFIRPIGQKAMDEVCFHDDEDTCNSWSTRIFKYNVEVARTLNEIRLALVTQCADGNEEKRATEEFKVHLGGIKVCSKKIITSF